MSEIINKKILVKIAYLLEGQEKVKVAAKEISKLGEKYKNTTEKTVKAAQGQIASEKKLRKATALRNAKQAQMAAKQQAATDGITAKNRFLNNWSKKTGMSVNKLSMGIQKQGYMFNKTGALVDQAGNKVTNFTKVMKGARKAGKRFNMAFLSVMFAGMALKRLFDGIRRAATTSFTKVMESNDMLGTSIQRLSVHWEFLKFTVGSAINTALEPLMPMILDVISAITQWVAAHPKLTTNLIIFGTILAIVLLVVGQMALAIGGLSMLFPGFAAALGVGLSAVFGFIWSLAVWIAQILLVVAAFALLGVFLLGIFFPKQAEALDGWVKNWQAGGGKIKKSIGFLIRLMLLGSKIMRVSFANAGDLIALAFVNTFDWLATKLKQFLNAMIKAYNWVQRLLGKQETSFSFNLETSGAAEFFKKRISDRSLELINDTPTLSELYNGEATPQQASPTINQTNNFNGIADAEEIQKHVDEVMEEAMNLSKSYA